MRILPSVLTLSMGILLVGFLLLGAADPKSPEEAKAQKLLDRMAEVYAKCKSYHDTGIVETVYYFEGNRKRTVRQPFATVFVGPDRFRFECKTRRGDGEDEFDCYIVWQGGKEIRSWWDIKPGVEEPKSLQLGLAGAAGVCGNAPNNVPNMLYPKASGWNLSKLKEPKQLEDARIGDVDCHRVEALLGKQLVIMSIDQKTFLLRRVESKTTFEKFRTETTTSYNPAIDEEILEKKLEFKPPKR